MSFVPDTQNKEFQDALNLIQYTRQSVFLTGKAGTGKSTFLRYICEHTKKKHVVLAPTGIAAINAGGSTLHSFFKLPFYPLLPDNPDFSLQRGRIHEFFKYTKPHRKLLEELELIIIDEISMVRADIIDAVDRILRVYSRNLREPFGGKQILLVGDVFQLEPVVKGDEREILNRFYPTPYFFSARVFNQIDLVSIELQKVYRQTDATFVGVLDHIRNNTVGATDLQLLNTRYGTQIEESEADMYITLATRRDNVDHINDKKLAELPGEPVTFSGEITGDFPESSLPTSQELVLKPGAQIIFIKNDFDRRWVNGTIGIISGFDPFEETLYVITDDGKECDVKRESWRNIRYKYNEEKKQIEEETAQSEEALRNTISSLTAQKKSAETLEKDIETLTEQIKRFQKERHEAIASQTPEEVIAAIETEKANATRLAEEAKLSLAAKEEALLSTQNKINSLEAHRSETIKSIESLSDAFNQKLQKAGFPNESSFLSSQISTAQKDDLMRQNDELLERYRVVNSQYEEKQQALNSLQEKNLTTRTREQLEEELLEKSDLFHTATAQLTSLREKMAKNANNKNRRKREEAEFQKLQTSLERWESLCANVEKPGGIARLGLSLAVAYGSADIDAFISGAKIKLRDEGVKLFAPELSDASGLADMKTISADQRFFVALSLLLGRSELFARRSKPEFVILKQNQNEAFPSQTFTGLESLNLTIGVAR